MMRLTGYVRPDGGFGVRNHIVVLSTVSCSNAVSQKIAAQTGAIPITHHGGCVEFEEASRETRLALAGAGRHPNVAGALIVGLGCEQISASELAETIRATGRPAEAILIQDEGGVPEAVLRGVALVRKMQGTIGSQKRVSCPPPHLVVGVQCGGSDWTTALSGNPTLGVMTDRLIDEGATVLMAEVNGFPGSEHILAERAISYEVGLQILDLVLELRDEHRLLHGQGIEEVNPTPGNKAGGITTLVEKSMGNIKKMGSAPVQGIVRLGDPIPRPGLWILDTRLLGPDTLGLTAFSVQGAHVTVFNTGRGTPAGSAVMPVIKTTGNLGTYSRLKSIIDFNAGVALEGRTIDETGQALYEHLLEVCAGKRTKAELNEQYDYAVPREHRKS